MGERSVRSSTLLSGEGGGPREGEPTVDIAPNANGKTALHPNGADAPGLLNARGRVGVNVTWVFLSILGRSSDREDLHVANRDAIEQLLVSSTRRMWREGLGVSCCRSRSIASTRTHPRSGVGSSSFPLPGCVRIRDGAVNALSSARIRRVEDRRARGTARRDHEACRPAYVPALVRDASARGWV